MKALLNSTNHSDHLIGWAERVLGRWTRVCTPQTYIPSSAIPLPSKQSRVGVAFWRLFGGAVQHHSPAVLGCHEHIYQWHWRQWRRQSCCRVLPFWTQQREKFVCHHCSSCSSGGREPQVLQLCVWWRSAEQRRDVGRHDGYWCTQRCCNVPLFGWSISPWQQLRFFTYKQGWSLGQATPELPLLLFFSWSCTLNVLLVPFPVQSRRECFSVKGTLPNHRCEA